MRMTFRDQHSHHDAARVKLAPEFPEMPPAVTAVTVNRPRTAGVKLGYQFGGK